MKGKGIEIQLKLNGLDIFMKMEIIKLDGIKINIFMDIVSLSLLMVKLFLKDYGKMEHLNKMLKLNMENTKYMPRNLMKRTIF